MTPRVEDEHPVVVAPGVVVEPESPKAADAVSLTNPPQPSMAPTTTMQQDITLRSQRVVNLIWEATQASVALLIVSSTMYVTIQLVLSESTREVPSVMSNALFLVIGFYFSRTNHQAIGGVGSKANENQEYRGR